MVSPNTPPSPLQIPPGSGCQSHQLFCGGHLDAHPRLPLAEAKARAPRAKGAFIRTAVRVERLTARRVLNYISVVARNRRPVSPRRAGRMWLRAAAAQSAALGLASVRAPPGGRERDLPPAAAAAAALPSLDSRINHFTRTPLKSLYSNRTFALVNLRRAARRTTRM